MNQLWFKAKTYGWGWQPTSWQGWVVIALYVVVLALLGQQIEDGSKNSVILFVIEALLLTVLLLIVAYKKGERPHWSWGKK